MPACATAAAAVRAAVNTHSLLPRIRPPQPPECDRAAGTCGSWVAVPYFLSFYLLVSVVMLNLVTAVILENFERMDEQVGRAGAVCCVLRAARAARAVRVLLLLLRRARA